MAHKSTSSTSETGTNAGEVGGGAEYSANGAKGNAAAKSTGTASATATSGGERSTSKNGYHYSVTYQVIVTVRVNTNSAFFGGSLGYGAPQTQVLKGQGVLITPYLQPITTK
jgi:hypothetical protein